MADAQIADQTEGWMACEASMTRLFASAVENPCQSTRLGLIPIATNPGSMNNPDS